MSALLGPDLFLAAAVSLAAQVPAEIERALTIVEGQIDDIELKSRLVLTAALFIGVAGAVIAGLQQWEHKRIKIAIVVLGILIASTTAATEVIGIKDHRSLSRIADDARSRLSDIRLQSTVYEWSLLSTDERRQIVSDIAERLREVSEMIQTQKRPILFGASLVGSLYAQSPTPQWLHGRSHTEQAFYFVGTGEARNLEHAQDLARADAERKAEEYLADVVTAGGGADSAEQLSRFLTSALRVTAWHHRFDHNRRTFVYYVLGEVPRRSLDTDLRLYSVIDDRPVTLESRAALANPARALAEYAERRNDLVARQIAASREALTPAGSEALQRARVARREGEPGAAVALLRDLVLTEAPDLFIGWYNLALAYDDQGDARASLRAYSRAAELEALLPERDPSFYNSMGWRLYRSGQFNQAALAFERALEIDAEHPRAQRNLTATRMRLAEANGAPAGSGG